MATTTVYGIRNDYVKGNKLPATEYNSLVNLAEMIGVMLAELGDGGIFTASDFNGSVVAGGLSASISTGRAIVGASGGRKLIYGQNLASITGLAATRDNWVYLKRDGTFDFVDVAVSAAKPSLPANTHPIFVATTNGTEVTSVNNLPEGRLNLTSWLAARVSNNDRSAKYLKDKIVATSPIVVTETNDGGDETLTVSIMNPCPMKWIVPASTIITIGTDEQLLIFEKFRVNGTVRNNGLLRIIA